MPASDFRKKALLFVAFAGVATLLLVLMPLAEAELLDYLKGRYGFTINASGEPEPLPGAERPGTMAETSVSLLVHIFHVTKILLWMVLIIAVVRFGAYLILSTFRAQSEVASLVRTILSIDRKSVV